MSLLLQRKRGRGFWLGLGEFGVRPTELKLNKIGKILLWATTRQSRAVNMRRVRWICMTSLVAQSLQAPPNHLTPKVISWISNSLTRQRQWKNRVVLGVTIIIIIFVIEVFPKTAHSNTCTTVWLLQLEMTIQVDCLILLRLLIQLLMVRTKKKLPN